MKGRQEEVVTLREMSFNAVSQNPKHFRFNEVPPEIGKEFIHTQLVRGKVTPELLYWAKQWKFRKLNFLNLDGRFLSREEIELLSAMGQFVEEIRFKGMHHLNNEDLISLFRNYTNLRRFQFSYSIPFDDEVAVMILKNNPNMEHFDVCHTRVTDKTLDHLAKCRNLTAIDVSFNIDVTEKGLLEVCNGPSKDKIEDIRLDMCAISDSTVSKIMKICPSLKNISTDKPIHSFDIGMPRGAMHNMTFFVPWS